MPMSEEITKTILKLSQPFDIDGLLRQHYNRTGARETYWLRVDALRAIRALVRKGRLVYRKGNIGFQDRWEPKRGKK